MARFLGKCGSDHPSPVSENVTPRLLLVCICSPKASYGRKNVLGKKCVFFGGASCGFCALTGYRKYLLKRVNGTSVVSTLLYSTSIFPSISPGASMSMIWSMVGARSARRPDIIFLYVLSISQHGTGLVVCAVFGEPSGLIP